MKVNKNKEEYRNVYTYEENLYIAQCVHKLSDFEYITFVNINTGLKNMCKRKQFKTLFTKFQKLFKINTKSETFDDISIKYSFKLQVEHDVVLAINRKIHIDVGNFLYLYNRKYNFVIIVKVKDIKHLNDNLFNVKFDIINKLYF